MQNKQQVEIYQTVQLAESRYGGFLIRQKYPLE